MNTKSMSDRKIAFKYLKTIFLIKNKRLLFPKFNPFKSINRTLLKPICDIITTNNDGHLL